MANGAEAAEAAAEKVAEALSELKLKVSADSEWAQHGAVFLPSGRADKTKTLPGGIYQYGAQPGQWWLERTADKFDFPFKVYNSSDDVIDRIIRYWTVNGGNLGILMNGLRGAGKTMTAQLLVNKLIATRNLPVLVVKSPIPLQVVFDAVKQDMVVLFDEFEKSHDKDHQQRLLSVIDGTSRSKHNRLVIFTTNSPTIDENFKDRPSRIHYQFEFNRVADEVIEGLIEDGLPDDLKHFKREILDYLNTRHILTIDIVKAVISEVRTFRESPTNFEGLLNISKGEPPSYTINILNPDTGAVLDTICYYFKPDQRYVPYLSGNKRLVEEHFGSGNTLQIYYRSSLDGTYVLNLVEKCKEDKCWLAEIQVPLRKTPWKVFTNLDEGHSLWIDERPEGWTLPFTPEMVKENAKHMKALTKLFNESVNNGTVYGTEKRAVFKISIEPNRDLPPSRFSASSKYSSM